MKELDKKYYTDYIGFNDYIEFRIFDNNRKTPDGRSTMFSMYASNIDEVGYIIEKYGNNKQFNVYCGINTRKIKGRKDEDIEYRRCFYIDIESSGEKPPLTDKKYLKKLLTTAKYIYDTMKNKGLVASGLLTSGRGVHLLFKCKPLSRVKYDSKFKQWNKRIIKELHDNRPFSDIKFDDSVFNIGRIESAVGTHHTKYEENPLREIKSLNIVENDMKPILEEINIRKYTVPKMVNGEYDENNIFSSTEAQLLSYYDELPVGERHNELLFMFKCLVRDNNIPLDIVSGWLQEHNCYERMENLPENYTYSHNIVAKYCLRYYDFCIERKIKPKKPYYDKYVGHTVMENEREKPYFDRFRKEIETILPKKNFDNVDDIELFIKEFHIITGVFISGNWYFFKDFLKEYLFQYTKKTLYDYLVFSGEMKGLLQVKPSVQMMRIDWIV